MPIPNDYLDIVTTLSKATNEGRVKWIVHSYAYAVSVTGSRFQIWGGMDEENDRSFVSFALSDEHGKILDTWFVDDGDSDYDFMQNLLSGAKRIALGVQHRLASIRAAMSNAEIIGDDDPPF